MVTHVLEISMGICVAFVGAISTLLIRTRTTRVRLCCGVLECYRRVRDSIAHRRSSDSMSASDSSSIP